jgi:hypothetical protein
MGWCREWVSSFYRLQENVLDCVIGRRGMPIQLPCSGLAKTIILKSISMPEAWNPIIP